MPSRAKKKKRQLKENIQKALKAELKKEGMFDQYVADPLAGLAKGVANIPRGVAGQLRLGSVNKKLERTAKRIEKEWDNADDHAKQKANKMQSSKNPEVSRMGQQVAQNVSQIDVAVKTAVDRINQVVSMGADAPADTPGQDPQFEDWLKRWGYDPRMFGKGPRYHDMVDRHQDLLQHGINPMTTDPKDWAQLRGDMEAKEVIAHAERLGLEVRDPDKMGEESPEGAEAPEGQAPQQAKAPAAPEMSDQAQQIKDLFSKKKDGKQAAPPPQAQAQPQDPSGSQEREDLMMRVMQQLLSMLEKQQGAPATPQQQQKVAQVAQQKVQKMDSQKKAPPASEYAPAPAFQEPGGAQMRSQGAPEPKHKLADMPGMGQVHSSSGARFEAPPVPEPTEQEAQKDQELQQRVQPKKRPKIDLPPREAPKELSSEEAEQELPLPSFADMMKAQGVTPQEDKADPIPLTKKKEKKSPGMSISDIAKNIGKEKSQKKIKSEDDWFEWLTAQPQYKQYHGIEDETSEPSEPSEGNIPIQQNDEGEIQIGQSPSEDPEGVGSSATYQAQDKRFTKKDRPSAKRKK